MAELDVKDTAEEAPSLSDGTEGSTVGYLNVGSIEKESSEESEQPDEEPGEAEEEEPEGEEESDEEEEELEDDKEPESKGEMRQADYTRKTQQLALQKRMANLAIAIDRDPAKMIPWLAEHYGIAVAPQAEAPEVAKPDEGLSLDMKVKANEELPDYLARVLGDGFGEILKIVKQTGAQAPTGQPPQKPAAQGAKAPWETADDVDIAAKIQGAMKYLDEAYRDWHAYEDEMVELIEGPKGTMYVNNVDVLYKDAKAKSGVPAVRAAARSKKVAGKVKKFTTGARGSGPKATGAKGKIMTADEAWDRAVRDVTKVARRK